MSTRNVVKTLVEGALIGSGVANAARRRLRGRVLVLAYHNIVPTGERRAGERSLHIPQRDFAQQLDIIVSTHDVVPLESVLDDVDDAARPRVVITFDDAYQGAITAGLDELRQRSMPATVFVAPGLLGGDTWWDRLAEAGGGTMPNDVRHHAIENLHGDRSDVLSWFASQGGALATSAPCPLIATESELAVASKQPGIAFGSHTWSHRNLSALTRQDLDTELAPPLAWLRSRFSNVVPWLAYPYGLSSSVVEEMTADARYRGALRVSGGWMIRRSTKLHALPRLGIPAGLSANGFRMRLAGIASNR
jgi:peptidoglycan/xylan/chitin deacetylase (PgdA/CDA1 family)